MSAFNFFEGSLAGGSIVWCLSVWFYRRALRRGSDWWQQAAGEQPAEPVVTPADVKAHDEQVKQKEIYWVGHGLWMCRKHRYAGDRSCPQCPPAYGLQDKQEIHKSGCPSLNGEQYVCTCWGDRS